MKNKSCENLRLLLVGPYPPPYGGIASHLTTLIPGLRARGANDIAIISFGLQEEVIEIDGATVYRINTMRHLQKLFSLHGLRVFAATLKTLWKGKLGARALIAETIRAICINLLAEKHDSQVVSFYQSDSSLALLPCRHIWKSQRSVLLMVFGELYDVPGFFTKRKKFIEGLLASPDAVISSSKHCACSFAKVLGISQDIEPVYLGVDLERFSNSELRTAFRKEQGIKPDEVLLVFMGRFEEEMGIGRLLEISPTILQRFPQIKMFLCGAKGALLNKVNELAANYKERVQVLTNIPFSLQPAIYAASDIVLAPSHDQHACMGMSIKEAMAASRPVIGSKAGGIPEAIIHGETGLLVPLNEETQHIDLDALLQGIELLVNNSDLRHAMCGAARRRAEAMFSMDKTNDKMAELFMKMKPAEKIRQLNTYLPEGN